MRWVLTFMTRRWCRPRPPHQKVPSGLCSQFPPQPRPLQSTDLPSNNPVLPLQKVYVKQTIKHIVIWVCLLLFSIMFLSHPSYCSVSLVRNLYKNRYHKEKENDQLAKGNGITSCNFMQHIIYTSVPAK